jgi:hypothetical protein
MHISIKVSVLFIISCLYSLQGYSQTFSTYLDMKNATLKEIIGQIEQKSNYTFVFNENLNMQQRKDISIPKMSVPEILKQVFRGTGIDWEIEGNHIILVKAKMITISGYVTDFNSMETLIGAAISDKHSGAACSTNSYGYYTMQVIPDSIRIQASYLGFKPLEKKVFLEKDTIINFRLHQLNTDLQAITVYNTKSLSALSSSVELTAAEIRATATTFGENDILKSLQSMPGVSAGFEGASGMHVRGGNIDQNLILIDGTPIYNTGHLWNLLSVLNGDAVKKATLYKNSFPARFGGRLSSVLDLRLKDGDMQRFHGDFTVSLYTARINVEGPIIKGKTSYSLSARRSYFDSYSRIARKISEDSFAPVFYMYDINAKINHKFSDRSRLYLSYYSSRDGQDEIEKDEYYEELDLKAYKKTKRKYNWGNDIVSLRWNYVFSNKLFMNTSIAYNKYKYNYRSFSDEIYYDLKQEFSLFRKSSIKDWQSAIDFEYQPNNSNYIRFGGSFIFHEFSPETVGYQLKEIDNNSQVSDLKYFLHEKIPGREMSLYGEDEFSITENLKANLGLHFSIFNVQGKTYSGLQPRLSVAYQLAPKLTVKGSYSKMNQYVNLLSSNIVSEPTDLWVPITKNLKPMLSEQFTGGVFLDTKMGYKVSLEGFSKKMDNVLEYKDGVAWKDAFTSWEENVESGKGWAYGLELLAQKTQGRFTGWMGYTLSWNNRRFPTINKGNRFPAKYDSRHNFNITASYKYNDKIDISASWMYATGTRSTLPLEQYQPLPSSNQYRYGYSLGYVGERNNYKMSDTHHLDIEMKYYYSSRKTWAFGVYNVYNRFNPYSVDVRYSGGSVVTEKALLGIMPSVSFTYKFK